MLVEPGSLCWVGGRMVEARDGQTWAVEFARFSALSGRRPGRWQRPGQGAEAGACPTSRRRTAGSRGFAGHLSHVPRGWPCPAENLGAASRALERAEAAQKELDRLGRAGESRTGHATRTSRLWRQAEGLWDQAMAAERAWKLTRSAFEFFTPEGRFNDRQQAQAVVAAALPHLSGPAWAKTRRLLLRRRELHVPGPSATASG